MEGRKRKMPGTGEGTKVCRIFYLKRFVLTSWLIGGEECGRNIRDPVNVLTQNTLLVISPKCCSTAEKPLIF